MPPRLSTQTVGEDFCFWLLPNFGSKTGQNLSEDLFSFFGGEGSGPKTGLNLSEDRFFGLHLIFGRKTDWFWLEKIFILVFVILKFSEFPAPLSKILCTLLGMAFEVWISQTFCHNKPAMPLTPKRKQCMRYGFQMKRKPGVAVVPTSSDFFLPSSK